MLQVFLLKIPISFNKSGKSKHYADNLFGIYLQKSISIDIDIGKIDKL